MTAVATVTAAAADAQKKKNTAADPVDIVDDNNFVVDDNNNKTNTRNTIIDNKSGEHDIDFDAFEESARSLNIHDEHEDKRDEKERRQQQQTKKEIEKKKDSNSSSSSNNNFPAMIEKQDSIVLIDSCRTITEETTDTSTTSSSKDDETSDNNNDKQQQQESPTTTTPSPSKLANKTITNTNNKLLYVTPKDFELLKVIGIGSFGKVLQVRNKKSQKVYAMKVISKRLIKRKISYVDNIQTERSILKKVNFPFLIKMHCSFQTKEKLFIIMDFLAGGELFLKMGRDGIFDEKTTAFYIGEITLALEHLHQLGILHRDLKPENILLSSDGHTCLTDFGLAKDFNIATRNSNTNNDENDENSTDNNNNTDHDFDEEPRTLTVCGTQEYMAPEMVAHKGYGKAADYWSLGCIVYEMLSGNPPFISKKGSKDLFRKIMSERVKMPDFSSSSAHKLIKGLLNRNATSRLGAAKSTMFEVGGVAGLKKCDFFKGLDWDKLLRKEIPPPVKMDVDNDEDLRHFHNEFVQMPLPRSVKEMNEEHFEPRKINSNAFRGFSFIQDDFELPDRNDTEVNQYWNQIEEDGESLSETASSLGGGNNNEGGNNKGSGNKQQQMPPQPTVIEEGPGEGGGGEPTTKKKRKRKKKNKAAAAAAAGAVPGGNTSSKNVTPVPSENGDLITPAPSENGEVLEDDNNIIKTTSTAGNKEQTKDRENQTTTTTPIISAIAKKKEEKATKQVTNKTNITQQQPSPATVSKQQQLQQPSTKPKPQAVETWEEVGKSASINKKHNQRQQQQSAAAAESAATTTAGVGRYVPPHLRGRQTAAPAATTATDYKPQQGSWAAMAHHNNQPQQRPQISTQGSGDWRGHRLTYSHSGSNRALGGGGGGGIGQKTNSHITNNNVDITSQNETTTWPSLGEGGGGGGGITNTANKIRPQQQQSAIWGATSNTATKAPQQQQQTAWGASKKSSLSATASAWKR